MKKHIKIEWFFLFPSLIGILIFYFIPFVMVVYDSLLEDDFGKRFGFGNYHIVIHNKAFHIAFMNTAKFILCYIPVLMVFSLIVAACLDYVHKKHLYTRIFLLPMAIPAASLAVIWKLIFHKYGLLNHLLHAVGLQGKDYFFTGSAFLVLGFTYLFRYFGYNMILWKSGIDCIEKEMYEAASLDGAGGLRKFLYITCPQLKDIGFVIVMFSILNSFKVFREAYLIAGDYPHQSIYMIQHLFNNWFGNLEIGKLSAGAVMIAGTVLLLTIIMKLVIDRSGRKWL